MNTDSKNAAHMLVKIIYREALLHHRTSEFVAFQRKKLDEGDLFSVLTLGIIHEETIPRVNKETILRKLCEIEYECYDASGHPIPISRQKFVDDMMANHRDFLDHIDEENERIEAEINAIPNPSDDFAAENTPSIRDMIARIFSQPDDNNETEDENAHV